MKIYKQEFENVIKLNPFDRYKYFIKRIADSEELWTLFDKNGDLALSRIDDKAMIPVWSAEDYIKSNIDGNWKEFIPFKIDFDYLEEKIIPVVIENGYLIDIFPLNGKSGFVVSLDEFVRDLNEELEHYE